jgi:hypothetical protein
MKKWVLYITIISSVSVMNFGCATQTRVTFYTEPAGAYIVKLENSPQGVAPITLDYNISELMREERGGNCFYIRGVVARWVSGTSTSSGQIKLCGSPSTNWTYTLKRNLSAPELEKDLQFALQIKALKAKPQSAQAISSAASAAWYDAIQNQPNPFMKDGK